MGNKHDKQIEEIEDAQEALRESIDESKRLAQKVSDLLQKHKERDERETD